MTKSTGLNGFRLAPPGNPRAGRSGLSLGTHHYSTTEVPRPTVPWIPPKILAQLLHDPKALQRIKGKVDQAHGWNQLGHDIVVFLESGRPDINNIPGRQDVVFAEIARLKHFVHIDLLDVALAIDHANEEQLRAISSARRPPRHS